MATSLHTRWLNCNKLSGVPEAVTSRWWGIIETRYTEVQRHYHTLDHLKEMFERVDEATPHLHQPHLVDMAVFFHDIIYQPKEADNEEKSVQLFNEFAAEYLYDQDKNGCQKVEEWILATKSHKTPAHLTPDLYGNQDVHYFLDTDMAVLGRPPEAYKEYAEQIRKEYIHIPEDVFRQRRAQVMKSFLQVPNIYASKLFRDKLEKRARENIRQEIQSLEFNVSG